MFGFIAPDDTDYQIDRFYCQFDNLWSSVQSVSSVF